MDLNREYLYNKEKIVLLVCDFYETSQIPRSMYEIKDNLALFPIANVPLIEYILANLADQHFKNVIVAGKNIESVMRHLKDTKFLETLCIRALKCDGHSLGDVFRTIDRLGLEFPDLIMMYANHYTNVSLNKLLKRHKRSKGAIMTLFTHNSDSNDINTHLYATKHGEVLYYEKTQSTKVSKQDIISCARSHKHIEVSTAYSSPTIAVISNGVFPLFTEHFDFETLGDFMVGILSAGVYSFKVQMVTQDDLLGKSPEYQVSAEFTTEYYSTDSSYSTVYTETLYCSEEPEIHYSIEVNTLLDYYKMNNDVVARSFSIFRLPKRPDCIKGNVKKSTVVYNSIVGEKSSIEGNIRNCIVWDNCHVCDDYDGYILFTDGKMFNSFHLESDPPSEPSPEDYLGADKLKSDTFFGDFNAYLNSCIYHPKFYDLDLNDVFKQISLLRIVWNASKTEVIEAFASFFVDTVDPSNLEDSISRASVFFGVLAEFVKTTDDQSFLMECMYDCLSDTDISAGMKAQVFFNYAFLFVESGIIGKSVVKKYNKMHRAGEF